MSTNSWTIRYVDDTSIVIDNKTHPISILNILNEFNLNMKFMMEEEINNKIAFLDVEIARNKNYFGTAVYHWNSGQKLKEPPPPPNCIEKQQPSDNVCTELQKLITPKKA